MSGRTSEESAMSLPELFDLRGKVALSKINGLAG
jgi:hypothetical protein